MNAATEAILRWHLAALGVEDDEIEVAVSTLREGIAAGERDSVEVCAGLLAQADEAAKGTEDAETVARLFELHFELGALELAEKMLEAGEKKAQDEKMKAAVKGLFRQPREK